MIDICTQYVRTIVVHNHLGCNLEVTIHKLKYGSDRLMTFHQEKSKHALAFATTHHDE